MVKELSNNRKNFTFNLLFLIDLNSCILQNTSLSELFSLVSEKNCIGSYSKGGRNFKKFKGPKTKKENKTNKDYKTNKDKEINNFKSFTKFNKNKPGFSKFNNFHWKFNKKGNYFGKFKPGNGFFNKFNFEKPPLKKKPQFINKLLILQDSPLNFVPYFFSPYGLKMKAKQLIFLKNFLFFKNRYTHFFIRSLMNRKIGLKGSWGSLLITIADLKMRAMLEHYDYFGLYSTSGNYISVHSELNPRKSLFGLLPTFIKDGFINVFFRGLYKKKYFKDKNYKFVRRFMRLGLRPFYLLERRMFRKLYLPLFGRGFEKTDPIERSFFLPQYEIFRKLLPNASRDFLGYMSGTTRYERYLYAYPYHYSALFFRNFIGYISNGKGTRFLNFRKYKVKFHHGNVLFSLINMMMYKVPLNRFTKRTDAHFAFPFRYVKIFLKKMFENKKDWLISTFFKQKSFFRDKLLGNNKHKEITKGMRLVFALNWSSGKGFFRKATEHLSFSKIDYFKTAKYVRGDLVVDSFSPTMRKDFPGYTEKFKYDTMNFNYKRLLRVLFPHQKLIEYNLLRSNNLYNYLKVSKISRKFFSLLKIFWSDWRPKKTKLSDYNLLYPVNFDFGQYESESNLESLLHDIDVSHIFYTHPYEDPYTYFKQILCASKKTGGLEFYFSRNLVLASSIIGFPILVSSRYYVEGFYFLVINKADFAKLSELGGIVRNFPRSKNSHCLILYKRYLDQFLSFKKIYSFLHVLLKTSILDRNAFYKNTILQKILMGFNVKDISIYSKYFFFVYILQFFNYLKIKFNFTRGFPSLLLKIMFWQFFSLVNYTKTLFKPHNMVIKPYFTQSLGTIKGNPITHFGIIGTRKTSSTGILTAFAYYFNIFAAPAFYNLTINRNNPNYFSQIIKKDQTFSVPSGIVINDLTFQDLGRKLYNTIFDGLYEFLTFSNYTVKNSKILTNEFIYKFKKSLLNIFPTSILNNNCFGFWYHYILDFDNKSINVLTSKMRGNTVLNSYFIGPLTITLFNTNRRLLNAVSSSEYNYLVTLLVLSSIEVQALLFADLIFPFQFDYKKLTLGGKHRLLKVFYEDNFFFFFKDRFFSTFYNTTNYLELQVLSAFTTSLFLNLTRYTNMAKYSYSHFDRECDELYLFPDVIFGDNFYDKYKFRWLFFGFTESFGINGGLISNYNSFLIILLHLSGLFVNTPLQYGLNLLQIITNFTSFITDDLQLECLDFLFPVVRYGDKQFTKGKFFDTKLSMSVSLFSDFYFYKNFLTKFTVSHFYYFLNENKQNNSFNNQLMYSLPQNVSFLTKLLDNHYDLFLKKIFVKTGMFPFVGFKFICFNRYGILCNFKKHLFFKIDFKINKTEKHLSNFSLVRLKQFLNHMLIIYNCRRNFIFSGSLNFLKKKILRFLFLLKLIVPFSKFSKGNLKIILFFYYFFFFLLKFFANRYKFKSTTKYTIYFNYLHLCEISNLKKTSPGIFVPGKNFTNNFYKSIFILRGDFGKRGLFFYDFDTRDVLYSFFTRSLSMFSFFTYNFFLGKIANKKAIFTLPGHLNNITNLVFNNLFYSTNFLIEYLKRIFLLINNQKKLTKYNFFFQPTGVELPSFFFDDESRYNYTELLKKMSVQSLLNSQTVILKNQNFFWFVFLKDGKFLPFYFDFFFKPVNLKNKNNKCALFLINKKKIFHKGKIIKNLFVYNTKFGTKGFRAVFYIKKLVTFFWGASKKSKKLGVFRKLVDLFGTNKLIQTTAEIRFLKTDTPKHKKSAKSIINVKLKLNKKINKESLYFFGDKILRRVVSRFLVKLLKRINLKIKFLDFTGIDLFYLQILSGNSVFLRDSLGLKFNKFFSTSLFSTFVKFLYLFVRGQNFFYNIIPILKLRRLNLLFTMLKKVTLFNDFKFINLLKRGGKLSLNVFTNGAEMLKLLVLTFGLTFFLELIIYRGFFSTLFSGFNNSFILLISNFLTKFKLNFKMFTRSFLLGTCFFGLHSIQQTLLIEANSKNIFKYKNMQIKLSSGNSIADVYKSSNLSFFGSLIYSFGCFNDDYFTDVIFFSRSTVSGVFIFNKPTPMGARLQNFELIAGNVHNLNLSYSIKSLLLLNIGHPLTPQLLIGLFFYYFLKSFIGAFCV